MPASSHALHIIQISDPHLYAAADGELRGVNTAHSLGAVLDAIALRRSRADLVAITGDLAQDESRGAYQRLRAMLAPLGRAPILTLPGNHDDPTLMAECLDDDGLVFCRPLPLGDWLMVPLNTHIAGAVDGEIGAVQLDRLRRTLCDSACRFAVIWLHHHPVPSGSEWLDNIGLRDAPALLETLAAFPQVRAVLWGHVHQAAEFARNGVLFASAPSSARQFRPHCAHFEVDDKPPGWRSLALHPDGTVTTEVEWLDGFPARARATRL